MNNAMKRIEDGSTSIENRSTSIENCSLEDKDGDMLSWLMLDSDIGIEDHLLPKPGPRLLLPAAPKGFPWAAPSANVAVSNSIKRKREAGRVAANKSRNRKRMQLRELENRVETLEKQNMQLKLDLNEASRVKMAEKREKEETTNKLMNMMKDDVPEHDLSKAMSSYADLYADYGRNRRMLLSYHLGQVKRYMIPTQVTKMGLWVLQQDDLFYNADDEDNAMWRILLQAMDVTEKQRELLLSHRQHFQQLARQINECSGHLTALETALELKNNAIEKAFHDLTAIVQPRQAVQFIQWITDNQACIHMLNKLWQT